VARTSDMRRRTPKTPPTGGKRAKASLKRPFPEPTKWFKGYVSRAQKAHFDRTPKLGKFRDGMLYDVPPTGFGNAKSKIAKLPRRVRGSVRRAHR
jgi:hypothetical protein